MKFSVLATSFNDGNEIIRYLENISSQTLLPDEILIVDGGSSDDTVNKIKVFSTESPVKVNVLYNLGRLNISQGYNIAIREALNDVIIITGIGNLYNKDFTLGLITKYKEGNYDMVTGPTFGYEVNYFSKCFNLAFLNGKRGIQYPPCNRCVLINKNIFKHTGYFYEHFIYAGEDTEYYTRAIKMGYRIGYSKDAITYWFTPQNYNQYVKKWKVNSIADMQLMPISKIVRRILFRIAIPTILISTGIFLYNNIYYWLFYILGILIVMLKLKTFNLFSIYLRIAEEYYLVWFYVRQWDFTKQEFHFKEDLIDYK